MREIDQLFQQWVRDHHAAVYRSAWRIVRDADDARDVTQEVFLQALRRPDAIARAASPERMLRWLAVKSALAQLRGDRNRRRREEESAMHRSERLPAEQHESRPEQRELADATRRAVAELPEELRLATTLRFAEGLTFAQVGECLGIAEPTAFERVKKALERLRERLTRLGYAAPAGLAAGDGGDWIDRWLAADGALAETVVVPASLAPALQTLATTATTTLLASKALLPIAATVALAIGGGLFAWRAARSPADGAASRGALAATAEGAAHQQDPAGSDRGSSPGSPGSLDATRTPDAPPAAPVRAVPTTKHGTLTGVVVDDDGRAVAGAHLAAVSSEGASKAHAWRGEAVSDASGAFSLELPVVLPSDVPGNDERGQLYLLTTRHDDFLPHQSEPLFVRADATQDLGRVKLRRFAADRAGDYTLAVVVEDEAGRPVPGAWVRLHRAVVTKDAAEVAGPAGPVEAGGQADASGVARLSGPRIGSKRLVIDARHLGFKLLEQPIEIAWTGFGEQRFTLEAGAVIVGRLLFPEGSDLAEETDPSGSHGAVTQVFATGAGEEWLFGQLARDGSFRIGGLDPGRYTLHVRGRCSPVELDVEATPESEASERTIALKRTDDASERGAHMGEIHGRFVDAASGAEVIALWDAIECVPVDDDDGRPPDEAALRDDLLPSLASPRVFQTEIDGNFVAPPPRAEFHAAGLGDRAYVVVARVAGYAPGFSRVIEIRQRALVKDVVIALERPASARGRVVDGAGRPIEGAFVVPLGAGPRSQALLAELDAQMTLEREHRFLFLSNFVRSGKDGRFELGGLAPLPGQRLAILHPRHAPATSGTLALRAGSAADAGSLELADRR